MTPEEKTDETADGNTATKVGRIGVRIGATSFSRDVAEYALKRVINGKAKIYLFDYLRDGDGVWRFDSM